MSQNNCQLSLKVGPIEKKTRTTFARFQCCAGEWLKSLNPCIKTPYFNCTPRRPIKVVRSFVTVLLNWVVRQNCRCSEHPYKFHQQSNPRTFCRFFGMPAKYACKIVCIYLRLEQCVNRIVIFRERESLAHFLAILSSWTYQSNLHYRAH